MPSLPVSRSQPPAPYCRGMLAPNSRSPGGGPLPGAARRATVPHLRFAASRSLKRTNKCVFKRSAFARSPHTRRSRCSPAALVPARAVRPSRRCPIRAQHERPSHGTRHGCKNGGFAQRPAARDSYPAHVPGGPRRPLQRVPYRRLTLHLRRFEQRDRHLRSHRASGNLPVRGDPRERVIAASGHRRGLHRQLGDKACHGPGFDHSGQVHSAARVEIKTYSKPWVRAACRPCAAPRKVQQATEIANWAMEVASTVGPARSGGRK
jgi:hypothetical protein